MFSLKFTVDEKELHDRTKKRVAEVEELIPKRLVTAANRWAGTAAVYTPPGMGATVIPEVLYRRRVLETRKIVIFRGALEHDEIKKHLDQGYFYMLGDSRKGRRSDMRFYKTEAEAEADNIIPLRGLLKAGYGTNLKSAGGTVPKVITALVKKSPAIKKYLNNNQILLRRNGDEYTLSISNIARCKGGHGNYEAIVKRRAGDAAKKYLKDAMRSIANKKIQIGDLL